MNQKKKITPGGQIAMGTGLRYDETNDLFHGERDGFDFIVYAPDARYPYMMVLHTAAKSADGSTFDKQAVKGFQKSSKKIASFGQKNLDIRVSLKAQSNAEKCKDTLNEALAATTTFLRTNSYSPCCDLCGQNVETGAFRMGGEYYHLCPDCEMKMRSDIAMKAQQKAQKKENIVGGIVGALLGSLLGMLSVLILSQLGYVAALSGVIMAVCVLKGYEMLGGKLTKKAVVISAVIMILMTYFADRVDWAIILFNQGGGAEAGYSLFECYRLIPAALSAEIIDMGSYIGNLVLQYLFVALGAIPTVIGKMKEKKEELLLKNGENHKQQLCLYILMDGRIKNDQLFQIALNRLQKLKEEGVKLCLRMVDNIYCEACQKLKDIVEDTQRCC